MTTEPRHLYITETEIKLGQMTPANKYASFTMLCKVDAFAEGQPSEFRKRRNELTLREHWHGPGKPTCEVCAMMQVILRANVRKREDRFAFTVKQMQVLLRAMEEIAVKHDELDREWKQGQYAEGNQT